MSDLQRTLPFNVNTDRLRVLLDVSAERERIDAKWRPEGGTVDGSFPLPARLPVLVEEVGEVASAMQDGDVADMRAELVQVAAVAVRWIEALDEGDPR